MEWVFTRAVAARLSNPFDLHSSGFHCGCGRRYTSATQPDESPSSNIQMTKSAVAITMALLVALCAMAEQARLNLFIRSESIDPGIVADFQKQLNLDAGKGEVM